MDFDSIIGQDYIKNSLINCIEKDQVGHAYIFYGPKGIGKKSVARIFAGALLCKDFTSGRSCGCCLPCSMLENGVNPDFHEVKADGTSIGIDEIRDIQKDIVIKPMYSQRKVYLIIDADKMTLQAQNCLLKTLEEPPSYAVIVLTTSSYESLIDTVRSRGLKCSFKKNTYEEVSRLLAQKSEKLPEEIEFIASYADGVIGAALELSESEEFSLLRNTVCEMVFSIQKSKMQRIFEIYEFFKENKENTNVILDIMNLFYRDLLVIKKSGKENMLINSDKKDIILSKMADFSAQKLIQNIEVIETARRNIKQNANYQLSIEVMLMKLQEE